MNETILKTFYKQFTLTKNLNELSIICKRFRLQITARDCNHTSCIIKTKTGKFYLSANKIERV